MEINMTAIIITAIICATVFAMLYALLWFGTRKK